MNTHTTEQAGNHSTPANLAPELQGLGIHLVTDNQERHQFLERNFCAPLAIKRFLSAVARRTISGYRHHRWICAYSESGTPLLIPDIAEPVNVSTLGGGPTEMLPPVLVGVVTTGLAILGFIETLGDHMNAEDYDGLIELYDKIIREGAAIAKTTGYSSAFLALTD